MPQDTAHFLIAARNGAAAGAILSAAVSAATQQRSLWNIVWGCLTTLFACTWVSIHPDIHKHLKFAKKSWHLRLQLMILSILKPDTIQKWAESQWSAARCLARNYRHEGWTMTHGYFLLMGGFVLYDGDRCEGVLSPLRFSQLVKSGAIALPTITKEEIEDRSKGDGLSKGLALLQSFWFVVQYLARSGEHTRAIPLEAVTLAFAVMNAVMYFFWWNKPLDVRCPVPVYLLRPSSPSDGEARLLVPPATSADECIDIRVDYSDLGEQRLASSSPLELQDASSYLLQSRPNADPDPEGAHSDLPNEDPAPKKKIAGPLLFWSEQDLDIEHKPTSKAHKLAVAYSTPLAASIFGAIHCSAWNFPFPSDTQRALWRGSSLVMVSIPVLFVALLSVRGRYMGPWQARHPMFYDWLCKVYTALGYLALIIHTVARCIVMVEAFATLRHLPESAFTTVQWISYLPHL